MTDRMATTTTSTTTVNDDVDTSIDAWSVRGRFGWAIVENYHVPYIFRFGRYKFTSVRIVEKVALPIKRFF